MRQGKPVKNTLFQNFRNCNTTGQRNTLLDVVRAARGNDSSHSGHQGYRGQPPPILSRKIREPTCLPLRVLSCRVSDSRMACPDAMSCSGLDARAFRADELHQRHRQREAHRHRAVLGPLLRQQRPDVDEPAGRLRPESSRVGSRSAHQT